MPDKKCPTCGQMVSAEKEPKKEDAKMKKGKELEKMSTSDGYMMKKK